MIDWNPIAEKFREADAILIGASNGLSITEGLHLFADNAAFDELFGDLFITTLIISKKPGNTGISRDIRTEFTTDLLLSD